MAKTTQEIIQSLSDQSDRLENDADILEQFVNGGEDDFQNVDGGILPSLMKAAKDTSDQIIATSQDFIAQEIEEQIGDQVAGKADAGDNTNITSLSGLIVPLSINQGGTGNSNGTANAANKLAEPRDFLVNLSSGDAAEFDGSDDASIGVSGNLDPVKSGTGPFIVLPTFAVAASTFVPSLFSFMAINGYYSAGDGGAAQYKKVTSEPSHPGKIQTADGSWWEFAGNEVSLLQTGCRGDSTSGTSGSGTDNTANFIKARDISYAMSIPVVVPVLPKGKAFRLASSVSCEDTVSIRGYGANVTVGQTYNTPNGGSWLFFDHAGIGINFRDNTTPSNSDKFARISGIGIDRPQAAPASGWTPSAALEDIHVEFNVDLDDVFFLKSSRCVKVRSAGQLQTRRVRGQALVIGFECERSSDVQRWDGDHFWPYWTQDTNVITYTKQNSYCYSVRRADGLMIDSPFGIFYKRVFFASDASGDGSGLANFHIRNLYADIGGGGIEINSNFYSAYGTIESYICNSDVGGNGTDGAAFTLAGTVASNIKLGMRSNRSPAEAVLVTGAAHQVYLTATYINGWAFVTTGAYAIKVTGGGVIRMGTNTQITTGNNLLYSKDSTSSITFPVSYDLSGPAISPVGFYSRRVNIADDSVAVIGAPAADFTANMHIAPIAVPGAGNPAGSVWLRASSSPSATAISLTTTTNVAITTGVLTGTTGTDGNLTISAANNGNFYIENRTGIVKTFIITLLGN